MESASLKELDEAFRLDYRKLVDTLDQNLKPARIVVRPYEKSQFTEGSIHYDFLETCSVEPDKDFFYPGENVNPSLGAHEMEFLRFCNQPSYPQKIRESISSILMMRSQIVSSKEVAHGRHSNLSGERQTAICDRYREGNDYVARQYLGRKNLPLFLDPLPEPVVSTGLPNHLSSAECREILRLLDVRIHGFKEILLRCCNSAQLQQMIDVDRTNPRFRQFLMEAEDYAKS